MYVGFLGGHKAHRPSRKMPHLLQGGGVEGLVRNFGGSREGAKADSSLNSHQNCLNFYALAILPNILPFFKHTYPISVQNDSKRDIHLGRPTSFPGLSEKKSWERGC